MEHSGIIDIKNNMLPNYSGLLSADKQYIFWNQKRFSRDKPGARFYFINRWKGEALRVVLSEEKVSGKYDKGSDIWRFHYNNQVHSSSIGPDFVRLDILERRRVPEEWKWQAPLGRSQRADIWKPGIKPDNKRILRTDDLMKIFNNGQGHDELKYCRMLLQEKLSPGEGNFSEKKTSLLSNISFQDAQRKVLMAIKTKPFLILAGVSGTGKSRLVRTLAYRTCTEKSLRYKHCPGNFELLKVKSNWHDSTELLGHPTQLGGILKYVSSAFIRFLIKAWKYKDVPFFLCLDEMNLAPVERYFAEYLSLLETRRYDNDSMNSDAFISKEDIRRYAEADNAFWSQLELDTDPVLRRQFLKYGITLPPNLIVIGTVNMDETTHTFSRKVLDRAMTIEMDIVDMEDGLLEYSQSWEYPSEFIAPGFLLDRLPGGYDAYHKNVTVGKRIIDELKAINEVLEHSPFRIAYRVRDEILAYCAYNAEIAGSSEQHGDWLNTCLDEMLLMKILSRIEGSEAKCGEIIKKLMQKVYNKFPGSYGKLEKMQWRLNNWGYTSYWQS
ncbi:McrB family protein [Chitinophaga tropicalis]|uniref:AAA domain-containing protein n=1 Tax=Chitinophaga tropicalis TaxID=2683588 RepID=A0A7K1UA00_9BACT|nr:AAA family ATPase [Chitinophaga tropicalis]MVT11128.1 AAA domain-containing protein [Chitinophaga tropicalis]